MSKTKKFGFALVFVICLLCVLFCGSALAEGDEEVISYTDVPVYVDGLLSCRGYTIGDDTYVSLETICDVLGYDAVFSFSTDDKSEETKTLTVEVCDILITVTSSDRYMCANGRCLYLPDGYIEIDGAPVFPIEAIAKIFTLDAMWHEESGTFNLDTTNEQILSGGDEFYNADDLYWLSHIITWEAGNQPLEGQIGVGNVVLNRVESPRFANTIKGVLFQPGQFSPVENGAIYLASYDISEVAAKLALEGYNTVGDALFFQTGYNSDATFVTTIADHNFFI